MKGIVVRFAFFIVVVFLLINGIKYIGNSYDDNGQQYLEDSINMAINSAYSTEGKYPADFEDLQKDYGIVVDEEKFVIFYESLGSNIRPEVRVIRKD